MHAIDDLTLTEKNYSKCPLKKRPVNYRCEDVEEQVDGVGRSGSGSKSPALAEERNNKNVSEQPQNLSLKKDANNNTNSSDSNNNNNSASRKLVADVTDLNVSDCGEDEGVIVDHRSTDDEIDCEDDEEELIDCVDVEELQSGENERGATTQAAALAAVAAATAASALVVPTPTYPPKYGLQPWNFHLSPYTVEFYRTINNPHHFAAAAAATQISPLRADLLSPSSPSDSVGSLSPSPPHHYAPHQPRTDTMSPPSMHRPIGLHQLTATPAPRPHSRFMPYAASSYGLHTSSHHRSLPHQSASAYALGYQPQHHLPLHPHALHHAPISPAYSENSYYSMRSLTPESACSPLPEDLSLKHHQPQPHAVTGSGAITISAKSTLPHTLPTHCHADAREVGSGVQIKLEPLSELNSRSNTPSSSCGPALGNGKKFKSSPPRYQCPDCQKSYSTFSGLTKHQQFHCPAAEGNQVKKSFSCKDCDKTYVSLGALKMHIRTHTLPCKCNICGKAFSRPWLLQGHIRTHTGEKPFSCQHCHRAFADRSNLRAHLQTHSDIKKYSCSNCSKTFSRMSLLTKHSEGGCAGGSSSSSSSTDMANSNYALYASE